MSWSIKLLEFFLAFDVKVVAILTTGGVLRCVYPDLINANLYNVRYFLYKYRISRAYLAQVPLPIVYRERLVCCTQASRSESWT